MNKLMLESVMKLHGDNGNSLSEYLGIARATFSAKINENGAEFTKKEMVMIKNKYGLDSKAMDEIFFA